MATSANIYANIQEQLIRAGDIRRHPENQRKSPLDRWLKKMHAFDPAKVLDPIHIVSDGCGKWFAIDGATRVEACMDHVQYGASFKVPCKIYGNGTVPTSSQLDELFLVLNTDKITVSAGIAFVRAVGAKRADAIAAKKQIDRLGSTFRTVTGVWKLVERYGEQIVGKAVTEALGIWGKEDPIPGAVISALVFVLAQENGAQIIRARHRRLKEQEPVAVLLRAKNDRNATVGTRQPLQSYVVKRLIGRTKL